MNKIYKAILSASTMAIVAGASMAPAAVMAWGDSANGRPSYTIAQINAGALGNTITFNSISDGKIGNEKNFVGAKLTSSNSTTWNADSITVQDGETYTIRLYVHNNSPQGTNNVATNVSATFSLPTTVAKDQVVIGYLNAPNANPTRYWDEVHLVSDSEFYLEYVPSSARYTNAIGTFTLSDNIITSSAQLGYDSMNGQIPGCFEYDGVVTIQVRVHNSVTARLRKMVRKKGTTEWHYDAIQANVGDEVEYQIEYVNLLGQRVDNVMIRDILPTNMEYVNDTTYLFNSNYQSGVRLAENTVTTSGINIGSYNANGNAYVRFTAKVVDKTLACGSNQLVNWANATVNHKVVNDDVSVMVNYDAEKCHANPTPTPDPDPTPTPTPNPTPTPTPAPSYLPNTGPEGIVAGALGTGAVVTAAGYFIASRKKLM